MTGTSRAGRGERSDWAALVQFPQGPSSRVGAVSGRSEPATQSSSFIEELIVLPGSVNECSSDRLLIDGGATSNFVAAAFAQRHNMGPVPLQKPVAVRMANGQPVQCNAALRQAQVTVHGHAGYYDLLMMPDLDGFDAILGRPFLRDAGAIVHHREAKIRWGSEQPVTNTNVERPSAAVAVERPAAAVDTEQPVVAVDERLAAAAVEQPEAAVVSDNSAALLGSSRPRPRSRRRVRLANVSSDYVQESEFIAELCSGGDPWLQQGVLRAFGMAAEETGDDSPTKGLASVSSVEKAKLLAAVASYENAMKPLTGKLPPSRGQFDHAIQLKDPHARPCKRRAIPLNPRHQLECKRQLDELEAAGLIRVSRSPWAAPVFLVPKEGSDELRMVCDYRGLNELIVKNSASLPHVKELLARLSSGRVFTKLDLKSGYNQVRIREEDIPLTAFVTPHGHFEWTVMPFGEANAPATFVQLMSQLVLADLLHSFVIVFQDDILVYSDNEAEHIGHVQQVLDRLQRHGLFLKPSKCKWMVREVDFLGHTIRATPNGTVIATLSSKIAAIREWPTPKSASELRSFLGLCNYYRDFVDGHSELAAPLTRLTGSSVVFHWTELEDNAFNALKDALCSAPALVVADGNRPFELHVDACNYAIGAVLSQPDDRGQLRPVGFFSRKLSDTQVRWSTYEKELFSIVAALEHWSMQLRDSLHPVLVHSDHRALTALLSQQHLTAKQTRWIGLLSLYRFRIQHVSGEDNVVADALSRRADHDDGSLHRRAVQTALAKQAFAATGNDDGPSLHAAVAVNASDLLEDIRRAYSADADCVELLREPERPSYSLRDGLLLRHDNFGVLVPNDRGLRARLLYEAHDIPLSGHLGLEKTLARLSGTFYWPGIRQDTHDYVISCPSCQRNKPINARPAGLLRPIPTVSKGHTLTIDFVGPLPRTARGHDMIVVVVDKWSKRAWYEAARTTATAKQVAEILFRRVVSEQLLPRMIVSDRDSRFTSQLWQSLWQACGTKLEMSTAYHHATDGQTERQNRTLEEMLRSFVNDRGSDWDKHLVHAEIAYNSSVHATTGFAPIRLHAGIDGLAPLDVAASAVHAAASPSAREFLEAMQQDAVLANERQRLAHERQKLHHDRHRRPVVFQIGDLALLSAYELRGPGLSKLHPCWLGPWTVLAVSAEGLNVTLELPSSMKKVHPTFHVERLRKWNPDVKFPRSAVQPQSTQPSTGSPPRPISNIPAEFKSEFDDGVNSDYDDDDIEFVETNVPVLPRAEGVGLDVQAARDDGGRIFRRDAPADAGNDAASDSGSDMASDASSDADLDASEDELVRPTRDRTRRAWDSGRSYKFHELNGLQLSPQWRSRVAQPTRPSEALNWRTVTSTVQPRSWRASETVVNHT